jgi:hypothetical protein
VQRARPVGALRWIVYAALVFGGAWLALQLFYFAQIAAWNVVDPRSTAFMRTDAAGLPPTSPPATSSINGCRTTRSRATSSARDRVRGRHLRQ